MREAYKPEYGLLADMNTPASERQAVMELFSSAIVPEWIECRHLLGAFGHYTPLRIGMTEAGRFGDKQYFAQSAINLRRFSSRSERR